jgi:hypothetical protein
MLRCPGDTTSGRRSQTKPRLVNNFDQKDRDCWPARVNNGDNGLLEMETRYGLIDEG